MHGGQVRPRDRSGPAPRPEQIDVAVQLSDDRLGQSLAQLLLVGILHDHLGPPPWATERIGDAVHESGGPSVVDDLAEHVQQLLAVSDRVQTAITAAVPRYRRHDVVEVAGSEAGRVGMAAGDQRLRGEATRQQALAQGLDIGPVVAGPAFDHVGQPRHPDDGEVDHSLGGGPAPGAVGLQVE